mgnify:CR=1 FL=1
MTPREKLRAIVDGKGYTIVPGAYDSLTARLVQLAGFEAVYLTGGGFSRSNGYPDIGLLSVHEVLGFITRTVDATEIPVIADIHFQWKYAMAALEAGIQGLRINPGNIKYHDKVRLIAREAKARGVPIRIGVNAGSLEKELLERYGAPTPEALVESALNEARILEDEDFTDIKISVKHSNPRVMIEAYRLLASRCDYPLHLGVTEAGPMPMGGVKSAVGIGTLLAEGIGDTIRVSLTDDPVEEVKVGLTILQALGLRRRGLDLVACPSCGRAEVDVLGLTKRVNEALEREGLKVPIRVAVMGCVVNGPGEAREADLGIAAGKGQGFLIVKGEVKDKIPEERFVEALMEEARRIAADGEGAAWATDVPVAGSVTASATPWRSPRAKHSRICRASSRKPIHSKHRL